MSILLENRNWTLPVVHYFKWKLEFFSNILSVVALHKKINLHRKAKFGCKNIIKYSKDVCIGASFSVQIIEVFPGTGYKNNKAYPVNYDTTIMHKIYETKYSFCLN